jgi:uncharacterized protein (DUF849 family)
VSKPAVGVRDTEVQHDLWIPLILTVAPNGARRGKADHPALPITPAEIARCAAECADAGAVMIHLHVRDRNGGHTLDADAYRAAIDAVKREAGERIVIQVTSEAVGLYTPAQQMAMVREVRPEAVSLAVRELVPSGADEQEAAAFFAWLAAERILAQLILYSDEDVRRVDDLVARGVIADTQRFVLFVLGRYSTGQRSSPDDLLPFLAANRRKYTWAMCAFGPLEIACAIASAALGGHARVGFENNLYLPDGQVAPNNAALISAVAQGAVAMGRPLADAETARHIMASHRPELQH